MRGQSNVRPVADEKLTVADLDEEALLARISRLLPQGRRTVVGSGDDAAVLAAPDQRIVVSTDVLVEGQHFRGDWGSAADVGWRAAMQNFADTAAMGAIPTAIVVGLVLPPSTEVGWVLDLMAGMAEACAPLGAGIVGGDLVSGNQRVVSVTVHGELLAPDPVRREGARPGDVVAFAGRLGWAAAGLALLHRRGAEAALETMASPFVHAFLRPQPPLAAAQQAIGGGVRAMMDISDGLLRDARRLARASGVVIDLDRRSPAIEHAIAELAPAAGALGTPPATALPQQESWVFGGGEDHGLLATFPSDVRLPAGFQPIGTVSAVRKHRHDATPCPTVLLSGSEPAHFSGWDHFDRGSTE